MADSPRIALARLHHDDRMQEKPDVPAVADDAETPLAPRVSRKIELRRILDRQHMTPARRLRCVTGRRGEHDLAGHRPIVQKPPIGHIPSPIAAKPPQTGRALGDQRRQKMGPLFCSRSSPNDPRSINPCNISSRESAARTQINPTLNSLGPEKDMCMP